MLLGVAVRQELRKATHVVNFVNASLGQVAPFFTFGLVFVVSLIGLAEEVETSIHSCKRSSDRMLNVEESAGHGVEVAEGVHPVLLSQEAFLVRIDESEQFLLEHIC